MDLYDAAARGDWETARELSAKVLEFSNRIYHVGQHGSAIIKGIKCSLSLVGICDDFMAAPFHRFHDTKRKIIAQHLEKLGIS